jgi:hypothetical protein
MKMFWAGGIHSCHVYPAWELEKERDFPAEKAAAYVLKLCHELASAGLSWEKAEKMMGIHKQGVDAAGHT